MHVAQDEVGAGEYWPATQLKHDVAPWERENAPIGQATQVTGPTLDTEVYLPATQEMHDVDPVLL